MTHASEASNEFDYSSSMYHVGYLVTDIAQSMADLGG